MAGSSFLVLNSVSIPVSRAGLHSSVFFTVMVAVVPLMTTLGGI